MRFFYLNHGGVCLSGTYLLGIRRFDRCDEPISTTGECLDIARLLGRIA
jgi:hypothetical protein